MNTTGLITLQSRHGPEETMKRLEVEVKAKGMAVFARINHAAGSSVFGWTLRPTDLLVFGAVKRCNPLMQSVQTIGIDMPWKALVWQDHTRATWLSYNDPSWLAKRHGLGLGAEPTIKPIASILEAIAAAATAS